MKRYCFYLVCLTACGGTTGLDVSSMDASVDAYVGDARVSSDTGAPHEPLDATGPDATRVDAAIADAEADACEPLECGLPTPYEQAAYVKSADAQQNDLFGTAIALDGDTLVVGAPWERREGPHFGSVQVFVRRAGPWVSEARLTATDGFGFGSAVSISGDTLAVRDRYGSLFVFVRSAGVWQQEAFLDALASDRLRGSALAIDGDTLAFNAGLDESTGFAGGAVYVWARDHGVWTEQAFLKAASPAMWDQFGGSLAISNNTLVVGEVPQNGVSQNAAHVFRRTGTAWTLQSTLQPSHNEPRDSFGSSVAIAGDTVVVGAPGEGSSATGIDGDESDNSADNSGAAYVFVRAGDTWTQQAYLKASNNEAAWYRGPGGGWGGDRFGSSVAVAADRIVIGAIEEESDATGINGDQYNNNAYGSGAGYVFARAGGLWSQVAYLKASNNRTTVYEYADAEFFGTAVAVSGETIAVSAPGENSSGINGDQTNTDASDSGAVYVFQVSR